MSGAKKGWAIVVDLNKCLGCQACSIACKVWWSSKVGPENAWWLIVETRPGDGYPKNWLEKSRKGEPQSPNDYEPKFKFRYGNLFNNPTNEIPPKIYPEENIKYGPNWEWDKGVGNNPDDTWFFYLPMQCMHCEDPPCVKNCPTGALYIREDGIVMLDEHLCIGCEACVESCPYRRVFFNPVLRAPSKCIMCEPLVESGKPPICVEVCPGQARFFGKLEDTDSPTHIIVKEYKAAVPLLPKFNTNPRIFYIPPVLTPPKPDGEDRYDMNYLKDLFGEDVVNAAENLKKERGKKESKLIKTLTEGPNYKV